MTNLCGYLGVFQPPLNGQNSTIYCVATPDRKNLVMIPLVSNFFETAYSVARDPKYQNIFLVLPSMDALLVSDVYLFYYEIKKTLNKPVEIFCNDAPQIPITDEVYSHIHVITNDSFELTDYLSNDDYFNIVITFSTEFRSPNRQAADICISTDTKTIYFCHYMTENKLKAFTESDYFDSIDEIHVPFMKTVYGGLNYMDIRRIISPKYLSKLYGHSFTSTEEAELCQSIGKTGEVTYYGFV